MSTTVPFTKMVGTGNDFVVIDARDRRVRALKRSWHAVSRSVCHRHLGIGADGVLVLEPSRSADVAMRIFNPDGTEAEMCGNGARCVALYLARQRAATRTALRIDSKAGRLNAVVRGERVAIRITDPTDIQLGLTLDVKGRRVRASYINTGVPHLVVPVDAIDKVEVGRLGRALRYHQAFAPRGTNVNFIQSGAGQSHRLQVRTYERGVEAETLACGTGVIASALIYALDRKAQSGTSRNADNGTAVQQWKLDVQPRSGELLSVSFRVSDTTHGRRVSDVRLEGAARIVFHGTVHWPLRRA